MDVIVALLELTVWFLFLSEKPKPPPPAPPDKWTPPTTEEIARVVGWPNTAPADPLYDRELDG